MYIHHVRFPYLHHTCDTKNLIQDWWFLLNQNMDLGQLIPDLKTPWCFRINIFTCAQFQGLWSVVGYVLLEGRTWIGSDIIYVFIPFTKFTYPPFKLQVVTIKLLEVPHRLKAFKIIGVGNGKDLTATTFVVIEIESLDGALIGN